jgi:hypothetical protein
VRHSGCWKSAFSHRVGQEKKDDSTSVEVLPCLPGYFYSGIF